MDRDRVLLGLAGVFAGLTTLLAVGALAEQPFLLILAVPFAATTYFLWYQASGRLRARVRKRRRANRQFGGRADPRAGARDARGAAAGKVGFGSADGRARRDSGARTSAGLSESEAYRTLGLDPDADETDIRQAYRTKVKEVHPDAETGDEEAFKRITRAYERLQE